MQQLLGTWQGTGLATYPTIESTRYREELTFREHKGKPIVQLEQKTWRIHEDGSETLLHWEFGFIRELEDSGYEWVNAQNNGRVEVMKGTISTQNSKTVLSFQSAAFANDPRMVQSTREVEVTDEELHYKMAMVTQTNVTMTIHLEADLKRA